MPDATLTISSKNYSSWSLRGWLLCKFAGLAFQEAVVPSDDPAVRAELLLLSPSFLVPRLTYRKIAVWDTIAIAEFLNDLKPKAGLLPKERAAAALCRSICGEMHGGFYNLRSALPMNLKGRHPGFKVWPGAQADVNRITTIWNLCLETYGGPFLFGERTMADAMYAPVATRFRTYDVPLDTVCAAYAEHVLNLPEMLEWTAAALAEPDAVDELDAEF
ncbi:MAG: glutathione S-transferase family protein [Candidatus Lustribacter sp.]